MSETKNRSNIKISDEHTNSHSKYEPADSGRLTNARQRRVLGNVVKLGVASAALAVGGNWLAGQHQASVKEQAQANEQAAKDPHNKLHGVLNQALINDYEVQYEKGTHNFYTVDGLNGTEYEATDALIFRVKTSTGTSPATYNEYAAFYPGGGGINLKDNDPNTWAYDLMKIVSLDLPIPESRVGLAHVDQGGKLVASQNGHDITIGNALVVQNP
jgi:hypothetical protein